MGHSTEWGGSWAGYHFLIWSPGLDADHLGQSKVTSLTVQNTQLWLRGGAAVWPLLLFVTSILHLPFFPALDPSWLLGRGRVFLNLSWKLVQQLSAWTQKECEEITCSCEIPVWLLTALLSSVTVSVWPCFLFFTEMLFFFRNLLECCVS